jgi:hypothetical protein
VPGGRRAVDLEKIIHFAARHETVFDMWSDCENFGTSCRTLGKFGRWTTGRRAHKVRSGPDR